jgi:antitoxin (DNA-binding transcriptional repressor) of toxin-antitoxin stability system
MKSISHGELQTDTERLIDSVTRGESFVITRDGVPVAELRPFLRRRFVPRDELRALFADGPHIDARQFRADLDRFVDSSW